MRPHRRQPTRLPRPWDSPGKNTGVGCHFLLQCVKVKSENEVAQLCPTPSDPIDCSPPGSSVHGIFQARVLEWVATAFSKIYICILFSISLILLLLMDSPKLKDYYAILHQYQKIQFFHILPSLPRDVILQLTACHVFIGVIFFPKHAVKIHLTNDSVLGYMK